MDMNLIKTSIWREFGATIQYLEDTVRACPDHLWHACLWEHPGEQPEFAQFWYRAYHTLFWLHLYLTGTEEGFLPPPPFELIEQYDLGPLPERPYTKAELLAYLEAGRRECKATIEQMTEEMAGRRCAFSWGECSFLELLIYNLRHVQEHAGQLNLFLGQNRVYTPDYITQIKDA
jgi:hypothetical protein